MDPRQYPTRELVEIRTTEVRPVVVTQGYTVNTVAPGVNVGLNAGTQNLNQGLTNEGKGEQFEENDLFYAEERQRYIFWARNLGYAAIVAAIASLVLASIHISRHHNNFIILLLTSSVLFLIGSIAVVVWATRSAKTYGNRDLFQPRASDNLTKSIFVGALLLAGWSTFLLTNLYVQSEYSPDYATAAHTNKQTWNAVFGDETSLESAISFFRIDFIVQSCLVGFFFFFFLLSSRAAFRCLKWDNQAMSYLVFLGSTLLLAFALAMIFYSNVAFDYDAYPQLKAHFPVWNIRALFILALAIAVISFVGFLIDHQSWRVGFFVLSFVLLVVLVLLVNFTGYSYRHSRQIYEYYKGNTDPQVCHDRIHYVHEDWIQNYGCPAKYVDAAACAPAAQVTQWETANSAPSTEANDGTNSKIPATLYCLNTECCGLLGQLYTSKYLSLSNWSLLAIVAGTILSIACYYFWYVSWVDTSRDKRKDFFWLGLMVTLIVVFLAVFLAVNVGHIAELTDANGKRY